MPYCRIYQGTEHTTAIAPLTTRLKILDLRGTVVHDRALPFAEQAFTNRRAGCIITLPVSTLPSGKYLLKLEASMDRQKAERALRFDVE